MVQKNGRDKMCVHAPVWACTSICIKFLQGTSGEEDWATREQRKWAFSLYNFKCLLNLEPCDYMAINENWEEKALQVCFPWFSQLDSEDSFQGGMCETRTVPAVAQGRCLEVPGSGPGQRGWGRGRRTRAGAELMRHPMASLLDNFKAC